MNVALHAPVLVAEIVEAAAGASRIVDATLGDGGHTAALLRSGRTVLAIDRDPSAIDRARERLRSTNVTYLESPFSDPMAVDAVHAFHPQFILCDLGVSGPQLDVDRRGFTFRPGAPLDMRMGTVGATAAELLNESSPVTLSEIFAEYGDEHRARRLAQEIVRRREHTPFATSDHLVNAIRAVLGASSGPPDFARLFQAVRIAVNDELAALALALPAFLDALTADGVLAVISYHSGEDRLVKQQFRLWEGQCICPPRHPVCTCGQVARGRATPRRGITASADEVAANPRARSARLRLFRKGNEH